MHMKLGGDVAELADIKLGGRAAQRFGNRPGRCASPQDLFHQDVALAGGQIFKFSGQRAARDQHDPRIAGVGLQTGVTERQVPQGLGCRQKGGIDLKHE